MIPTQGQFSVANLDTKRAEKVAAKVAASSPFGPVQAGVVNINDKNAK